MRLPLALLAACLAASAATARAEDRFGPQQGAMANAQTATLYEAGRALTWGGKTQPRDAAAPADIRSMQSAPLADGLLRLTSANPYAPARPAVQAVSMAEAAPAGPLAPAPQPRTYAAQAFQAQAPIPEGAAPGGVAPVAPPTAPTPLPLAGAVSPDGTVGPRYYSVLRDYGVDPDPIPMMLGGVGQ